MKEGYVYILTNKNHTVLYTGVTSDLPQRIIQHKEKFFGGFAAKYNVNKLVYFEECGDMSLAIEREKQIKSGSRAKKIALINSTNPQWRDLSEEIV